MTLCHILPERRGWLIGYIYIYHHRVVPLSRISLTLSRHFSLSFIASCRSSGLHPVSSHSCRMYVRAGRPALARPYVGVHRSSSLMSSPLLPQQCPACLVRLTWMVFVMGGRWPYSWYLVVCCYQDLFNTYYARSMTQQFVKKQINAIFFIHEFHIFSQYWVIPWSLLLYNLGKIYH